MNYSSRIKTYAFGLLAILTLVACESSTRSEAEEPLSSGSVGSSSSISVQSSTSTLLSSSSATIIFGTMSDGTQSYNTVVIGSQTWMAENLNTTPASGSSWCYDNLALNCATWGRLYDWSTAMNVDASYNTTLLGDSINHQGICPTGWHMPRNSEWATLEAYAGGALTAGIKLKTTSGWDINTGTDAYGFSALSSGDYIASISGFDDFGVSAFWWSANENTPARAGYFGVSGTDGRTDSGSFGPKNNGFSVRCVQN